MGNIHNKIPWSELLTGQSRASEAAELGTLPYKLWRCVTDLTGGARRYTVAFLPPVIGVQEVEQRQTVRVEMCYLKPENQICELQTLDNDHEMRLVGTDGALAVLFAAADTVGLSGGVISLLDKLCCCDTEPEVWFESLQEQLPHFMGR